NIAEIAINVLTKHCLARRIPDRETMISEVTAWQNRRNEATKSIDWRFTTEKARLKLKSLYPAT
ncbi:MAG: IS630 family transposase, partial [Aestuariivita sp.]|nr:IS630 family transposase [Aestuariivita sp.]